MKIKYAMLGLLIVGCVAAVQLNNGIWNGVLGTDFNANGFSITNGGTVSFSNIVGNLSGATNLNADNITTGTLKTNRFPSDALLITSQLTASNLTGPVLIGNLGNVSNLTSAGAGGGLAVVQTGPTNVFYGQLIAAGANVTVVKTTNSNGTVTNTIASSGGGGGSSSTNAYGNLTNVIQTAYQTNITFTSTFANRYAIATNNGTDSLNGTCEIYGTNNAIESFIFNYSCSGGGIVNVSQVSANNGTGGFLLVSNVIMTTDGAGHNRLDISILGQSTNVSFKIYGSNPGILSGNINPQSTLGSDVSITPDSGLGVNTSGGITAGALTSPSLISDGNLTIASTSGNLVLNAPSGQISANSDIYVTGGKNYINLGFNTGFMLKSGGDGSITESATTSDSLAGFFTGSNQNGINTTNIPSSAITGALTDATAAVFTNTASTFAGSLTWTNLAILNATQKFTGVNTVTNLGNLIGGSWVGGVSNLLAPSSITFPATTVNWTNTTGRTVSVFIDNSGVTGSATKINGTQVYSSLVGDIFFILQPNETFSETYTIGTPTARIKPF